MTCRHSDVSTMINIAVFCAASESIDSCYVNAAREVGTMIGRMGASLVYGGAKAGLMEATAKAAKEAGARVVGVVPEILVERNRVSSLLDEHISCCNLSERKEIMLEKSNVLVALPGGIGTLDEIFHVLAAATIGFHNKLVVLYNINGFWDGLIAVLDSYRVNGFLRGNVEELMAIVSSADELEMLIKESCRWRR